MYKASYRKLCLRGGKHSLTITIIYGFQSVNGGLLTVMSQQNKYTELLLLTLFFKSIKFRFCKFNINFNIQTVASQQQHLKKRDQHHYMYRLRELNSIVISK